MKNKEIIIPTEDKFRLQRVGFEINNATNNAAFMLSHHLSDEDASFLDSDIWKSLIGKAEKYRLNSNKVYWEIASSLVDGMTSSTRYGFRSNYEIMEYQTNA